eukprot:CAMPEP_0175655168 /NCGR_PEP_ID=MMETSP0097-20121207/11761_1 /TAXON_ID=311494 /ORGANISM="Alexandrium monilatum, Strain CCMP3105" /LENGTH=78 /DNA_ID=CAMNT_0016961215 /DNA_START=87 /DNA_END=321 /DNA_ORIENTATION=+
MQQLPVLPTAGNISVRARPPVGSAADASRSPAAPVDAVVVLEVPVWGPEVHEDRRVPRADKGGGPSVRQLRRLVQEEL